MIKPDKTLMRGRTIVISGQVGSGKTTISRLIMIKLRQRGSSVCYDRITAYPLISYLVFKMIAMLLYGDRIVRYHESASIHPSTLVAMRLRRGLGPLSILLILIESLSTYIRFSLMNMKCKGKDILLVDEGFVNIVANYLEVLGLKSRYLVSVISRIIRRFSRSYDLYIFYLRTRTGVLIERWIKRGYPKETPLINTRYHLLYNIILDKARKIIESDHRVKIVDLDASESPVSLVDSILRAIQ